MERAIRYEDYAVAVGEGEIVSRRMIAERMGVHYSTATYHLENAVKEGLLNRAYGYVGKQPGWIYAKPETMAQQPGMEHG